MSQEVSETAEQETAAGRGPSVAVIGVFVLLLAGAGAAGWYFTSGPTPAELRKEARSMFRKGEYREALKLASTAYESEPSNRMAMIAGESAQKLNDLDAARDWYRRLEDDDSEHYLKGVVALSLLCLNTGRMTEAEEWFRKALEKEPANVEINRWFASLLNAQGRRWEASRHYFIAVREGVFPGQTAMDDLLMLANFEAPFEDIAITEKAIETVPDDPLPLLGRVQGHFVFNRYKEGLEILRRVIEKHPDQLQAHAWLGRGLVDSGELDALREWNESLPQGADEFPLIWHIRGLWASKAGQMRAAARCFWEAVRREPNFQSANYQLGLSLVALNETKKAEPFLKRHKQLSDYHRLTHPIYDEGPRVDSLVQVMDLSGELGRLWEQFAWSKFLLQFGEQSSEFTQQVRSHAVTVYERLRQELPEAPRTRTLATSNPARDLDLSSYPLPDWSRSETGNVGTEPVAASGIRFDDIAEQVGLSFTYFNSAERRTQGMRIFESMGGGVAAFDFDHDGWPDLYFTQGSIWPVNPDKPGERDLLFRSLSGEAVENVTLLAGLGDANYTQGVNVGDFNSDGFPDLYIGNIGKNRLFHNNGDGTFTEASDGLAERPWRWTTSVMIADLNADGHPDLFDANYLSGDDVYDRLCGAEVQRVCAPSAFAGEQDDIHLSNGDGTWSYATESTGLSQLKGKGLGIVAGDFDGNGRLNLFVANDGIENYYLVPSGEGSELQLQDTALERGVAFDYDSRGQACMGVAVDDYNGDERLDMFVTNYYEDSNTLYTMLGGNLFEDRAREAKLRTPSFHFLGFGTQFIDADLDGWPDLVLTNGHVDDFSHQDIPFRMRPQFYRNVGGRFEEIAPAADSEYMNKPQLGRGLARLDFDKDGRGDFAVNHLDTPAALARNTTPEPGKHLTVRLVGVESNRDAIGTSVTVHAGGRKRTMQMTAGDGYHAANERSLVFGLGAADSIDRVVVQWPSGVRQTLTDASPGSEILVREDERRSYVLTK